MKHFSIIFFFLFAGTFVLEATQLKRTGWNLMAVCQDISRADINMTGIEEIQSQEGQSIYTGDFASYSNLETLHAGYGYWVKGEVGTVFNSGESLNRLEKPLNRDGWNLMASCENISSTDVNMTYLEEIQRQDGATIYTGDFSNYSNLNSLDFGYGYWIKGVQGTLFTSNRALSTLPPIDNNGTTGTPPTNEKVSISGKVTYDRIHVNSNHIGLDYNNITQENARQVVVEAIDINNSVVATTTTDDNGEYLLANLPNNQNIKIRVYAKMFKNATWDVKVIDNYNNGVLYVIEGNMETTGSNNSIRNLTASSSNKSSPPFAILDSVYTAMQKVYSVDSSVVFPALKMNWSVNNIESGTYYDGIDNIMLQGDQNGDSDEYDDHVVTHEWGHYYEDKFSRTDSIGGAHGAGDHLDIRVAFGEGFGNAMSAIVSDDPIYFDTFSYSGSSNGWYMNIESETKDNPGWFSEASIQRILYDLYDSDDDGEDQLSLGFSALHDVFIDAQKNTEAFTSIFSFITEFKLANPDESAMVDSMVSSENMATITDSYGSGRSNLVSETPLYTDLTVGEMVNVCTKNGYGSYNKLNNRKYIKFIVSNSARYTISVAQSNGTDSDPDFQVYKASPHTYMGSAKSPDIGVEETTLNLTTGSYLLDISDDNNIAAPCFNVTVNSVN
ncbi:hypothetical protein KKC13_03410 [bacterium]|nr:hypothetical protein [bacterium]MBU1957385.1 hypothetical protein [bacterium]